MATAFRVPVNQDFLIRIFPGVLWDQLQIHLRKNREVLQDPAPRLQLFARISASSISKGNLSVENGKRNLACAFAENQCIP